VDALVEQRSTVEGEGAPPLGAVVVALSAVPLRPAPAEHKVAEGSVVEQAAELDESGVESALGDHPHARVAVCPLAGLEFAQDSRVGGVLALSGGQPFAVAACLRQVEAVDPVVGEYRCGAVER
jgi:hypothetical protein